MLGTIKNLFQKGDPSGSQIGVVEAYDIWSKSYDFQPGNLMLDLDEQILTGLLENVDLGNKVVVDIGCGTGRHWDRLYNKNLSRLLGFDVSPGMLEQLQVKFPGASTHQITDNRLGILPDSSVDFLLTTLTMAHIQDAGEAIRSWSRVLKEGGDLLITDFHPATLAKGGRRSFIHEGKTLSVLNYVHSLTSIKACFQKYGLKLVRQEERWIDEEVKHYYAAQQALPVYDRFKGTPIIYGLLLKKQRVTE